VRRLFLLDGTALAYRSHFALAQSGLSSTDGQPTGATYGFTMTLRRILETEKPDLVAVALDARGKTFRHAKFPAYKATREKAPEELIGQLPFIREVTLAHGIPLFEIEGYEADDVIGTLARQAEAAGCEVAIVTGDKDFMQLVSEHVKLYNVFKKGEDVVVQGFGAVEEKFGTGPDRVCEVLAIMGDASDNIPGVKGIGEKGAIKLIGEYGTVAGVLEHLDEISPKLREKLETSRDQLLLSRELVEIDTGVPLDPGFESIGPPAPKAAALMDLFKRLDFQSLVAKVEAPPEDAVERDYVTVATPDALRAMVDELTRAGAFALDTETTSLFPLEAELVGVSFCARAGRAFYVPFNLDPPLLGGTAPLLAALEPLLMSDGLERCGQNYKYDALVLAAHGARPKAPDFDTMVASFCVAGASRRHSLDSLALHYFNLNKIPTRSLIGSGQKAIGMDAVPLDQVAEYACEDADITWRLREVLEREMEEAGCLGLFHDLEMPLVPVLGAMEERGIRLDTALLEELSGEFEREIETLVHGIQELAGRNFNVNSTKVLGQVLFEELRIQDGVGVKRPRKTKTGWSTDAATLNEKYGEVPIVRKLLEYREISKLKSTYVDALPRYVNARTGRVHCSFSQTTAATGRLASSDPNLQNIPVRGERGRRLREAFVPGPPDANDGREWVFLAADYSQIELRVMAHFAGDEKMIAAFERGADVHATTAAEIFGVFPDMVDRTMRSQAKVINFGLLYGMGPQRVARETGMSLPEARDFVERYFAAFPRVREWIEGLKRSARETGWVETLLGHRRRVPDINSQSPRVRAMAENAAVNTPIQGTAADIIKKAMIDLEARLAESGLSARLLLQVHDELLLEVPAQEADAAEALVRECMEHAVVLDVPLAVECGRGSNWLEAH
jgi:DNA polymerase-1